MEKILELPQHRLNAKLPPRHQLLRKRALVMNHDVCVPTTGTQTLQQKLIEAEIEHLLPLACNHPRLLRREQTLARARRAVNRRRALIAQILQQRELRVRQTRR